MSAKFKVDMAIVISYKVGLRQKNDQSRSKAKRMIKGKRHHCIEISRIINRNI